MNDKFSLLISQLGYHKNDNKKAYLRSAEYSDNAPKAFCINDIATNEIAYKGSVEFWGEKWQSFWWTIDFSELNTDGKFKLVLENGNESNEFHIRDDVFTNSRINSSEQLDLVDIAMHQLDYRLKKFSDEGAVSIDGVDGEYIPGYRDCGSEIRELSSHVVTLHALLDMYENQNLYRSLSEDIKDKLLHQIKWCADYIVFSQEKSENPLYNGRFDHDAGTQTNYGTTGYHNWHDSAYALTALGRLIIIFDKVFDCKKYIDCAKLGFINCEYRMYNLKSDISARTANDGTPYLDDENGEDDFYQLVNELAQCVYNKPENWEIPAELKVKDKLAFTWASMLLYQALKDEKYFETAVKFADSAMERQFTDWENPIDNVYGNFYAYEKDNLCFELEWNQNHKFHMGNIEPTNVKGFMELYNTSPNHPNAALWYNVILTFADKFMKKSANLSPLGIYPISVYSDKEHGGVKFFQVTNHGGIGLYGQISKHMLELADFLGDKELSELAVNNLQFVAGLNPGIPRSFEETQWAPKSMIVGLGTDFFYVQHSLIPAPMGSGVNGFSADEQFRPKKLGTVPDAPKGILFKDEKFQFNEDYLPHSHGYVSAVAVMEKAFELNISTYFFDENVCAEVIISDGENKKTYLCDKNIKITDLELMKNYSLTATYKNEVVTKNFVSVGGGSLLFDIDFGFNISAEIVTKEVMDSQKQKGLLIIKNHTNNALNLNIDFLSSGVDVICDLTKITVAEKSKSEIEIEIKAQSKVMPYLIIANINGKHRCFAKGLISSSAITTAKTYVINSSLSVGGKINLQKETHVTEGGSFTLIASPNDGYKVGTISVNGKDCFGTSYLFGNIQSNQSVNIEFIEQ